MPSKRTASQSGSADVASATLPTIEVMATVRHYCQGLGDAHLLSIPKGDGSVFRMLIDCGVHSTVKGGSDIMRAIAKDIKAAIGSDPIDVLVITHEHWDHVSGFSSAKTELADIKFKSVWMPWTENPDDAMARQLDTYRGNAIAALSVAQQRMASSRTRHLVELSTALDALMGFHFGAEGDKVRTARNRAAASAAPARPSYLEPGMVIDLPGSDVRVFVLGPPRDRAMLRLEESDAEMYHFGGRGGWSTELALSAGLAMEGETADENVVRHATPFAEGQGHDLEDVLRGRGDPAIVNFIGAHYSGRGEDGPNSSRRIDQEWLAVSAELALQLDRAVNNTSLVLAFEFISTGRVMLFPGDAQIGSWKSWDGVVWEGHKTTAADLLARTIYLKVAHHGSHNATPHRLGLDRMTNPDLSAFIPVSKSDAVKADWLRMPFEPIIEALSTATSGRVIRADDSWIGNGEAPADLTKGSVRAVRSGNRWVEVDIF